jgi:hypothetical protein
MQRQSACDTTGSINRRKPFEGLLDRASARILPPGIPKSARGKMGARSRYFRRPGSTKWKISEFGFDVLVVETDGDVPTPVHKKPMPVFGRPLWQVESEMDVNGFEVGKDLGKLVAGAAANKLLVTRFRNDVATFNNYLIRLSRHSTGALFVAYLPSYSRLDKGIHVWTTAGAKVPVDVYELSSGSSPPPMTTMARDGHAALLDCPPDTGIAL